MEITLSYDEVLEALRLAVEDKTKAMFTVNEDNCSMRVVTPEGVVNDIDEITFTAIIEAQDD